MVPSDQRPPAPGSAEAVGPHPLPPEPGARRLAPPDEPAPVNQIRRSRSDQVVAGVCGGLGHAFGIDPLWCRLATVVLVLANGAGVLLYLVAWVLIPEEDSDSPPPTRSGIHPDRGPIIAGLVLVSIGLILLLNTLIPWFDEVVWPLVLVSIGAALIYAGSRR